MDEIERSRVRDEVLAVTLASEEETVVSDYEKARAAMEEEYGQLSTALVVIEGELRALTDEYNTLKPDYDVLVVTNNQKLHDTDLSKKAVYGW
jgi:hypothetical protein